MSKYMFYSVENNGFYSASLDQTIYHVDRNGNPDLEFRGHTNCVNSVSQVNKDELVSGSWDGTAIVWDTKTGVIKAKLEGHQHAVAVLALENGSIITGSQDKAIKIWYNYQLVKQIPAAHDDIIRAFTQVSSTGFASCSNDQTVKLWSLDGKLLKTFKGHMGFVFDVKTLSSGEIVSASDDCTVRIWNAQSGECKQILQLPRTVWSVAENSDGNLVVGTEDGSVRSFTRNPAKQLNEGP